MSPRPLSAPVSSRLILLSVVFFLGALIYFKPDHCSHSALSNQSPVISLTQAKQVESAFLPTEGVTVIDGDTVTVRYLHLPYNVCITGRKIRALDYDTYESRQVNRSTGPAVDAVEIAKGKVAATAFNTLLSKGRLYVRPPDEAAAQFDSFGRMLGRFYIRTTDERWIDVADYMKRNNHVRPR